jgi:hypothetical protein
MGICCLALSSAACSTLGGDDGDNRARFMPSMPSMPSMPAMPTINLADISIPGTDRQAPVTDPDLEPVVYWRVIEDDILVVHAKTQGCTSRSDFVVNVEQYHEDIYTVRLNRGEEDLCSEDLPWGIQLGFGFEELGVPAGGRVIVLNPMDQRPWDWDRSPTSVASRR